MYLNKTCDNIKSIAIDTISCGTKLKYQLLSSIRPQLLRCVKLLFIFDTNGSDVLLITTDDEVYGFGQNKFGTLGLGHYEQVKVVTRVDTLCGKQMYQFVSGYDFMVGLTESGEVYTWGMGHKGRLGNGLNENHVFKPKKIIVEKATDLKVVDIKCTYCSTILLTDRGQIYWFGYKGFNNSEQLTPICITGAQNIGAISSLDCGVDHSIALTNTGQVYTWGRNDMMQLGLGHSRHVNVPALIELDSSILIKKIASGSNHNLLLTSTGAIYTFGGNISGQLGIGTHDNQNQPQLIVSHNKFVDIYANDQKSMALSDKGFVYIWGQTKKNIIVRPERTEYHCFQTAINHYFKPVFTYRPLTNDQLFERINRVQQTIAGAFNNQKYSDLTFKIQNRLVFVHKWFVVQCCKHFDLMFTNEWLEKRTNIIEISGHTYEGYYEFLQYLYTDVFDTNSVDVLIDVLHISDEYMEPNVKLRCVQHLKPTITMDNVCTLYTAALMYNSTQLEVYCFEFMADKMFDIISTDCYKQMPDKYAKHLLTDYVWYLHELTDRQMFNI